MFTKGISLGRHRHTNTLADYLHVAGNCNVHGYSAYESDELPFPRALAVINYVASGLVEVSSTPHSPCAFPPVIFKPVRGMPNVAVVRPMLPVCGCRHAEPLSEKRGKRAR